MQPAELNDHLRPSRVLEILRGGGVASCTKLNLGDARVAEIAAASGADCVWLDMEHAPNALAAIENQVRAIKACGGADSLVRVKRGGYSDLVHPLEMDATGIMVPHVMSAEDARAIARQTRFHPVGRRALDGGNADGSYCVVPLDRYLRQANDQRMVVVQIEDPEAMEELNEIASVDGIDMLFFGPGDFSHAIGAAGQFDDPRVIAARRRVAAVAATHGKFAGTVGTFANRQSLIDEGYRFISIGADVVALVAYFRQVAESFGRNTVAQGPRSLYAAKV